MLELLWYLLTLDSVRNLLLPVGVRAERQRAKFIIRIYRADGLPRYSIHDPDLVSRWAAHVLSTEYVPIRRAAQVYSLHDPDLASRRTARLLSTQSGSRQQMGCSGTFHAIRIYIVDGLPMCSSKIRIWPANGRPRYFPNIRIKSADGLPRYSSTIRI
jgi:hypothetical protein